MRAAFAQTLDSSCCGNAWPLGRFQSLVVGDDLDNSFRRHGIRAIVDSTGCFKPDIAEFSVPWGVPHRRPGKVPLVAPPPLMPSNPCGLACGTDHGCVAALKVWIFVVLLNHELTGNEYPKGDHREREIGDYLVAKTIPGGGGQDRDQLDSFVVGFPCISLRLDLSR